jgi:hypothetical protein
MYRVINEKQLLNYRISTMRDQFGWVIGVNRHFQQFFDCIVITRLNNNREENLDRYNELTYKPLALGRCLETYAW